MTKNNPPLGVRRRSQPNGPWLSDEMLFGITRGLHPTPRRHGAGRATAKTEPVPSFEETYPKHPFSELVRLGIRLGRWLAALRDGASGRSSRSDQREA